MKFSGISLNSIKFHWIWWNSWNLMEFKQMECPESLKFHWNYKLFSTWPPKYPILLKYTKNTKIPHFCWNSTKKSSKVRKRWFLKIWADFHDSRADSPLQNLCNSLCFHGLGRFPVSRGARGRDFAISQYFTGIIEIHIIWWISGNFIKNQEFQ